MRSGSEIDQRDPVLPELGSQKFVIRQDIGLLAKCQFYDGCIPGGIGLDDLIPPCEIQGGIGIFVIQMLQFPDQWAWNYETYVSEKFTYRIIQIDT